MSTYSFLEKLKLSTISFISAIIFCIVAYYGFDFVWKQLYAKDSQEFLLTIVDNKAFNNNSQHVIAAMTNTTNVAATKIITVHDSNSIDVLTMCLIQLLCIAIIFGVNSLATCKYVNKTMHLSKLKLCQILAIAFFDTIINLSIASLVNMQMSALYIAIVCMLSIIITMFVLQLKRSYVISKQKSP